MTLNDAIINVLLNQFKKYMNKEAIEMVEQAGYTIVKVQGGYEVKNPTTRKWVQVEKGYRWKIFKVGKTVYANRENIKKFDFVNYLNKPINVAWAEVNRVTYWGYVSPTRAKIDTLKNAKSRIKWQRRDIDEVKQKIANLQGRLESEIRYLVEYENELEETRKKLGLK